jgi:hypothetical protein
MEKMLGFFSRRDAFLLRVMALSLGLLRKMIPWKKNQLLKSVALLVPGKAGPRASRRQVALKHPNDHF